MNDLWTFQSWHPRGAYRQTLDPRPVFDGLLRVAGSRAQLLAGLGGPPAEWLAAFRDALSLPPFEPEMPWLLPTPEWVADLLREFVAWHEEHFPEQAEKHFPVRKKSARPRA